MLTVSALAPAVLDLVVPGSSAGSLALASWGSSHKPNGIQATGPCLSLPAAQVRADWAFAEARTQLPVPVGTMRLRGCHIRLLHRAG